MVNSTNALINPKLLKYAREQASLSIDKAAAIIGVSMELLMDWENGNLFPTFDQLYRIADAYGVSLPLFYLSEAPEINLFMRDKVAKKAFDYLKSIEFTPEEYREKFEHEDNIV